MIFGTATTWSEERSMHFEVLVEDQSCRIALDQILEKILGTDPMVHSWRSHHFKGPGCIPSDLHGPRYPKSRLLLDNLPSLLRAYGKSLQESAAVIVVVDLDRRDCMAFKRQLLGVLNACNPRPRARFRIAIEESEAWLLGDRNAVKAAYPCARDTVLIDYKQDSICGTWEVLADAVNPKGSKRLKKVGYPEVGIAKCDWARNIAPHLDVNGNQSKSFQVFRDGVRSLAGIK